MGGVAAKPLAASPQAMTVPAGSLCVAMLDDDRICGHVRAKGAFEPDTLKAWQAMCHSGGTVLDIGAYSGVFSIVAAKMGATAIAIEPLPVMCERIRNNAHLNHVDVEIIEAAASNQDGNASIGFNDKVHLTSGASLLRKSEPRIRVRTVRVDSLDIGRVSAIKIDVETFELRVLEGAAETLKRWHPRLIIEVLNERARQDITAFLRGLGYAGAGDGALLDTRNMIMERE
jgi:FkbM family methyltransferase